MRGQHSPRTCGERRARRQIVDVPCAVAYADSVRGQREAQALDEEHRRVLDGRHAGDVLAACRYAAAHAQRAAAGQPLERDLGRTAGLDRRHHVVDDQAVSGRRDEDRRGGGDRRTWRDAHGHEILVVTERARGRRIRGRQVVPRPSRAQRLVVERVVVADETAVDARDTRVLQHLRPFVEQRRRAEILRVDGGIARADHDEIAAQDAIDDGARGLEPRVETMGPAKLLAGHSGRDDLQRRGRHHARVGVAAVEHTAVSERLDVDGNGRAGERGYIEAPIDGAGERAWRRRCGR